MKSLYNNRFKAILFALVMLLIIPMVFFFTGCSGEIKVTDIEVLSNNSESTTYLITFDDDSTMKFTIPRNLDYNSVSIKSIEQESFTNSEITYKITYEDDTTFTYTVPNNSSVSIDNVTFNRREGLKDYYWINFSNGTHTEFAITNGKDGADGVTLQDMYEVANTEGQYENITEFIEDYLNINLDSTSTTVATGKAVLSTVSVKAEFPVTEKEYNWNTYKMDTRLNTAVSAGAGVIYNLDKENGDAYIITNCHVVYSEGCDTENEYAKGIYCYLYGQESAMGYKYDPITNNQVYDEDGYPVLDYGEYAIPCTLVGASISYDIAVLKVEDNDILKNSNARATVVSNSNNVKLCDTAIAIGNPSASGISVTSGVISVISEYINVSIDSSVNTQLREFRIDTAVNSGNSGGGLFNDKGEFIGVVNAKTSDDSIENMGYAIPSNVATSVADNIIKNAETGGFGVKKMYLGVTITPKSSKNYIDTDGITVKILETVSVVSVEEDSLAESMLFKADDIISNIVITDGTETRTYDITRMYEVIDIIMSVRLGETITFNCISNDGPVQYSHTAVADDFIDVV